MNEHQFVIVGAGPAGLAAASILAKKDNDVLVLDKRSLDKLGDKLCAGGVSFKLIPLLPNNLVKRWIYSVVFNSPSGKKWCVQDKEPILGITERDKLSEYQVKQAIDSGATLEGKQRVTNVDLNKKSIRLKGGKEIRYGWLVGADGANSLVRKALGLPKKTFWCFQWKVKNKQLNDIEIYLSFRRFGFGAMYLFPHEDFVVVGGGGPLLHPSIKDFKDYAQRFFENKGLKLSNSNYGLCGIGYDYLQSSFPFRRVSLIGDAGGFADPITGEGIAQGILSADLEFGNFFDKKSLKSVLLYRNLAAQLGILLPYQLLYSNTFFRQVLDFYVDLFYDLAPKNKIERFAIKKWQRDYQFSAYTPKNAHSGVISRRGV